MLSSKLNDSYYRIGGKKNGWKESQSIVGWDNYTSASNVRSSLACLIKGGNQDYQSSQHRYVIHFSICKKGLGFDRLLSVGIIYLAFRPLIAVSADIRSFLSLLVSGISKHHIYMTIHNNANSKVCHSSKT